MKAAKGADAPSQRGVHSVSLAGTELFADAFRHSRESLLITGLFASLKDAGGHAHAGWGIMRKQLGCRPRCSMC
jgi:hypothetical protein